MTAAARLSILAASRSTNSCVALVGVFNNSRNHVTRATGAASAAPIGDGGNLTRALFLQSFNTSVGETVSGDGSSVQNAESEYDTKKLQHINVIFGL